MTSDLVADINAELRELRRYAATTHREGVVDNTYRSANEMLRSLGFDAFDYDDDEPVDPAERSKLNAYQRELLNALTAPEPGQRFQRAMDVISEAYDDFDVYGFRDLETGGPGPGPDTGPDGTPDPDDTDTGPDGDDTGGPDDTDTGTPDGTDTGPGDDTGGPDGPDDGGPDRDGPDAEPTGPADISVDMYDVGVPEDDSLVDGPVSPRYGVRVSGTYDELLTAFEDMDGLRFKLYERDGGGLDLDDEYESMIGADIGGIDDEADFVDFLRSNPSIGWDTKDTSRRFMGGETEYVVELADMQHWEGDPGFEIDESGDYFVRTEFTKDGSIYDMAFDRGGFSVASPETAGEISLDVATIGGGSVWGDATGDYLVALNPGEDMSDEQYEREVEELMDDMEALTVEYGQAVDTLEFGETSWPVMGDTSQVRLEPGMMPGVDGFDDLFVKDDVSGRYAMRAPAPVEFDSGGDYGISVTAATEDGSLRGYDAWEDVEGFAEGAGKILGFVDWIDRGAPLSEKAEEAEEKEAPEGKIEHIAKQFMKFSPSHISDEMASRFLGNYPPFKYVPGVASE